METTTKPNHAEENAIGWLDSIREMTTKLEQAECLHKDYSSIGGQQNECDECGALLDEDGDAINDLDSDSIREEIQESPLSVQVRGGWYSPGDSDKGGSAEQYEILLSTGGPALRIVGNLDHYGNATEARLEYQDWGTPWTYHCGYNEADRNLLMAFVGQFYFGEGE